jgi:predicted DNA repair protein MutK
MATSLLALLDDIATLLDDVAAMTKVAARQGAAAADDVAAMTQMAAKKTAGVLGDDLALNAQQVTGVSADRELPVVWAVAKGSMLNKAILVPAALVISWLVPWAITPLLMLGGLFLCFEGFEKLAHKFLHSADEQAAERQKSLAAVADEAVDLVAFEKEKIKGAVRTDFILSAEIVVITLGTVAAASLGERVAVLVGISILMTVGVYGLVAGIVKLDDVGLHLNRSQSALARRLGAGLLVFAPWLMKALSVVGTAAMFMVGGGILVHGWPLLHHAVEALDHNLLALPGGAVWSSVGNALAGALVGVVAGAAVLGMFTLAKRLRPSA